MSLPRFISIRCGLMAACGVLLLAGCAGGGAERPAADTQRSEAAASDDSSALAAPAAALSMYEQATSVMAAGDYLEAELRFKEFLLRYPDYAGAHVNLAIIQMQSNDDAAAEASLQAALRLSPNNASALNQLGLLHRRNGKFPEAEAAYLKAVTASPGYALAHYNLGVLNELYLQRLDVALHHFEEYQALVGDDKQVEKWIADLRRRLAAAERTANVAD